MDIKRYKRIFYVLLTLTFITFMPMMIILIYKYNCPSIDDTFNCTIIDFLSDSNYYCFKSRTYSSKNHNNSSYGEGTHCNSGYRPKYDCPFDTICYTKYSTDIYDYDIINQCNTFDILLYIFIPIFFLFLLLLVLFTLYVIYYKK